MSVVASSARSGSKQLTIEMVIIGVDGKPRANLGTVAYWHRNPARRLWWRLYGQPASIARILQANKPPQGVQS